LSKAAFDYEGRDMSSNRTSLRHAALTGGLYLAGRQVISIAMKIFGVLIITRLLGPQAYGSYVSASSIYNYIMLLGQAGIGVYLLRHDDTISETTFGTAYTMLLALSAFLFVLLEVGRYFMASLVDAKDFTLVAGILALALPLQLMSVPATVRLERNLNYKAIAFLELGGSFCFYAISAPLVWFQFGAVSLAIGFVAQQIVTSLGAFLWSRTYPKFAFDGAIASSIFGYATKYSIANWIFQLKTLINPLIVGPILGTHAVGLVAMAIGLLDVLSTMKNVAWRLAIAILARVQHDKEKLRIAVREGMELQALAVGVPIVGFALLGPFIVPWFFGERWAPVMDVFPYIAVGYFASAVFNMHSSVLSLLDRNHQVAFATAVYVALFAGTVALSTPHIGFVGYGLGECVGLLSYMLLHLYTRRAVGEINYLPTAFWAIGGLIGMFWGQIGIWAIAMPFVALAMPGSPGRLMFYYRKIRSKS
jgi:PST family polysaccharide transporter